MLTILTGGPGCGKTTRLLEQMHMLAKAGEPSVLLVPESGSHQAERRLWWLYSYRVYLHIIAVSFHTIDVR